AIMPPQVRLISTGTDTWSGRAAADGLRAAPFEQQDARRVFERTPMNRREFIGKSAAVIAASRLSRYETLASQIGAGKRVGIIGAGWYGKTDLLRLRQVAPVNVVSMCDVDSRMLNDAADLVAARQASKQRPRLYAHRRRLLAPQALHPV